MIVDTSKAVVVFDHECSEAEEIRRNVKNIIMTPKGTMPGSRGFGLDHEFISYPFEAARNIMAVALAEEIMEYEPRAEVEEVTFYPSDDNGVFLPKIKLTRGDGL